MTNEQIRQLKEARSTKRPRSSVEAYAQMDAMKELAKQREGRADEILKQRFNGLHSDIGRD